MKTMELEMNNLTSYTGNRYIQELCIQKALVIGSHEQPHCHDCCIRIQYSVSLFQ